MVAIEKDVADHASRHWEHLRKAQGQVEEAKIKWSAHGGPDPRLAGKVLPVLAAQEPIDNPSLSWKRSVIRKSIQGQTKEEKAAKRQKLIQATSLERFPNQTFLEQVAVSHEVALGLYKRPMEAFNKFVKTKKKSIRTPAKLDECVALYLNKHVQRRLRYLRRKQNPSCSSRQPARLFPQVHDGSIEKMHGQTWIPGQLDPLFLCPHCPARDKDDDGRLQPISPGHSLDVLCLPQAVRGSGDSGQDVVSPSKAVKSYAINLHPMDRLETSKTGLSDDSFCSTPRSFRSWGDGGQAQEHLKQGPLFSINYSTLNQHWKGALTAIGLKHNWGVFYQLRHSGPSHDRLHKLRSTLEVKLMGRWSRFIRQTLRGSQQVGIGVSEPPTCHPTTSVGGREELGPDDAKVSIPSPLAESTRWVVEIFAGCCNLSKACRLQALQLYPSISTLVLGVMCFVTLYFIILLRHHHACMCSSLDWYAMCYVVEGSQV